MEHINHEAAAAAPIHCVAERRSNVVRVGCFNAVNITNDNGSNAHTWRSAFVNARDALALSDTLQVLLADGEVRCKTIIRAQGLFLTVHRRRMSNRL